MAHTQAEFLRLLQRLLPVGQAWTRSPDAKLTQLLNGCAAELARVDTIMESLLTEALPSQTSALLEEWEADYDMPDPLFSVDDTVAGRREALSAKINSLGSLTPQYFIDLAALLGYTITIDTFQPFWCGLMESGDECGDVANIFTWRVNVLAASPIRYFRSGESASGDMLQDDISGGELALLFNEYKPAHTKVIFREVGPGFSAGFSSGFDALTGTPREGGFSRGFSTAGFNTYTAGGFSFDGFSSGYSKPA